MAAEGLPAGGPPGALPGWELEAWYQDLQEVLAAAEPGGPSPAWVAEPVSWGHGPGVGGTRGWGLLSSPLSLQAELAPLWGVEGAGAAPGGCELDAALAAELLELLGPDSAAGTHPAGPPGSAPSRSSPPRVGAAEDDATGRGAKRKKRGSVAASRELAKRREVADEQRVLELTAHNEQLREEIRRLSAEVERTRAALIDRMVNLRCV